MGSLQTLLWFLLPSPPALLRESSPSSAAIQEKKDSRVRHQIRCYALLTALLLALLSYAVIFLLADPIADLFNKDQNTALTSIAADGMRIYFTSLFFSGINIVAAVFLSSTDHPKQAFILSLLRGFLLIIPAAFLLAHLFGLTGIWMSLPVTEGIVCIFSLLFLKKV